MKLRVLSAAAHRLFSSNSSSNPSRHCHHPTSIRIFRRRPIRARMRVPTALHCLPRQWKRLSAAAQKTECSRHAATSGRPSVRNFPQLVHIQCLRTQRPLLSLLELTLLLPSRVSRLAAQAAVAAELVPVRVVLALAAVRLQSMPRMRLGPRRPFAALIRHRLDTFSTPAGTAVRQQRLRRNRGARRTIVPTPVHFLRPRRRRRLLRVRRGIRGQRRHPRLIQCTSQHPHLPKRRSLRRRHQCSAAAAERKRPCSCMPLLLVCHNNKRRDPHFL